MTVTPPLAYCEHGYCETEHCRTCEIMGVCKLCQSAEETRRADPPAEGKQRLSADSRPSSADALAGLRDALSDLYESRQMGTRRDRALHEGTQALHETHAIIDRAKQLLAEVYFGPRDYRTNEWFQRVEQLFPELFASFEEHKSQ